MSRPIITKGKTGIGNFGVGVMPDGTSSTLRVLIKPDGFHFVPSDFEDLVLSTINLSSQNGSVYEVSVNDNSELLINGKVYTPIPVLTSPDGTNFKLIVNDDGKLTTEKEVTNA